MEISLQFVVRAEKFRAQFVGHFANHEPQAKSRATLKNLSPQFADTDSRVGIRRSKCLREFQYREPGVSLFAFRQIAQRA
jgi:hypothetical protein